MPGSAFWRADEVGRVAEVAMQALLESWTGTNRVEDVSQDPTWQDRGVDAIWHRKDGTEERVEVKGDQWGHKYPNFWLETVSNRDLGTLGCFLRTQSDWYAYCYNAETWTERRDGSVQHVTLGKKVPIQRLLAAVPTMGPFDVRSILAEQHPGWEPLEPVTGSAWR